MPRQTPLGAELFDELLRFGGAAENVPTELAEFFRINFEVGMRKLVDEHFELVGPLLCQMARYFAQFRHARKGPYEELFDRLKQIDVLPVVATLNYDLLIEYAARRVGWGPKYGNDGNEQHERWLNLLKLHGSCNFIPKDSSDMGGEFFGEMNFVIGGGMDCFDGEEAFLRHKNEKLIPPVMSAYVEGKSCYTCPEILKKFQHEWSSAALSAKNIIIIGVALNEADDHIWRPIAHTNAKISAIDQNPDPILRWGQNIPKTINVIGFDFAKSIQSIVDTIS
jgi:hypothetical protein